MSFAEIVAEKIEKIPPLPDTVVKIEQICNDESSSISDLVKVVELDPILTARILKVANSPYYGFTSKISTVSRAIALLGMKTILTFAMDIALKSNFKKIDLSPYALTVEKYREICFKQNRLMMLWHAALNLKNSDFLIPAAFLSDLGKLIISEIIIESGLKNDFLNRIKNSFNIDEVFKIEREYLGHSSLETTGKILFKWRLDVKFVLPIIGSESPENADESLKPYSYALKIVKVAIGQFGIITRSSLQQAMDLLDKTKFSKRNFLMSVKRLK